MTGLSTALAFTWLGLLLGISFIETPLKFRAPGMTVELGLGIGRLVFGALNRVEIALAVALSILLLVRTHSAAEAAVLVALVVALAAQIGVIRPRLNRRTDRLLASETLEPSRLHLGYIAFEVTKVALLIALGTLSLQA